MEPDHTYTWTSGGIQHTINTFCQPNETPERCLTRHDQEVADALEIWPKDPGLLAKLWRWISRR